MLGRLTLCFLHRAAVLVMLMPVLLQSQNVAHDFSFLRSLDVPVFRVDSSRMVQPWVGGLNVIQSGRIDLDADGDMDLVLFDRHGHKILPFINSGVPDSVIFRYDPSFRAGFPLLQHWMQLTDYDGDGRTDIFSYTIGGIQVYKNVTLPSGGLRFEQVKTRLNSWQNGRYVNLLVTTVDYPAIADLDGDGDLDILTFFGLGSFVELHTNRSVELYGHADSLVFERTDPCWGRFIESGESNLVFVDTSCHLNDEHAAHKHTGSTLTLFDADFDGDYDLLLGDVDYPGLILLENNPNNGLDVMTDWHSDFPTPLAPANLLSFPLLHVSDLNNDGREDMLLTIFDPGLTDGRYDENIWFYRQTGDKQFELVMKDFLQGDMIDLGAGAYPALADLDQDGRTDLLIGNYGRLDSAWYSYGSLHTSYVASLQFYRNVGTLDQPAFMLTDANFLQLDTLATLGLYPSVGDLNGDGWPEMVLGQSDGTVRFYRNCTDQKGALCFEPWQELAESIDAGQFSTPQLFDLDQDGLLDLLIGCKAGTLSYYKNTGTIESPSFLLISDRLGGVDVKDASVSLYGFSAPCFFRTTGGEVVLFVGSEQGDVYYYNNISDHLDGVFTLRERGLLFIKEGIRSSVAVDDLDADDIPDMLVGNYAGGLVYFKGDSSLIYNSVSRLAAGEMHVDVYPNPASSSLNVNLSGWSGNCVVEMLDLTGRQVARVMGYQPLQISLDVSHISTGVYLLLLHSNQYSEIRRVAVVSD